jgi:Nickel responsive protein SCO4226-like
VGLQHWSEQPAHDIAPGRYLGSTIVIGDDACYCQFEAPSPATVIDVNRRVDLPVDRIVAAVAVTPSKGAPR